MTERENFNFKAATGFGAIVDGSVTSTNSDKVARELAKQGLIPVRISGVRRRTAMNSNYAGSGLS